MKTQTQNLEQPPTIYAVGDHFQSPHGEVIITRITPKYVFYEKAGSKAIQDSITPRHLFDQDILSGKLHSHRKETTLERAMRLVDDFCIHEYKERADFSNMQCIGIAYTTLDEPGCTGEEYSVQVNLDLVHFRMERFIEDVLVDSCHYDSLEEMCAVELSNLDFDNLVSFWDEQVKAALGHAITH